MITVKHVTASGRADQGWTFYPPDRRIDVLIRRGACPLALALYVCSREQPAAGAHRILRVDSDSWRILPERFMRIMVMGLARLIAIPAAIGSELAPGEHLLLTCCPENVTTELEAL